MKTLYLTLSLLLLAVCCSPALYSVAPGSCCFKFSTKRVPVKSVADIKKTHHSCVKKGMGGRAFSYQAPLLWNQLPVLVQRQTPSLPLRVDLRLSFLIKLIVRAGSGDPEPFRLLGGPMML
uniref:Chemokine interleukin-8-like domain-containing protein n=1 Tax=Monopterus albus TaxID=43700 RepID=A0A3Q3ILL8_MONAL